MNPTPAEAIRSYLAERDEACPGCGYNLRGAQEPVCPECGREVRISIARGDAGRGWLLLLLVALGWVAVMSGLHTAKGAVTARRESRMFQSQVVFSSAARLSRSVTLAPQPARRSVTTPIVIGSPQSASVAPTVAAPAIAAPVPAGTAPPVSTPTFTVRSFAATGTAPSPAVMGGLGGGMVRLSPATVSWSSVRWQTWTLLGVAAALMLAALVGLTIVVRGRQRILAGGPSRLVWSYAAAVCGLYAAGQLYLLARDLIG